MESKIILTAFTDPMMGLSYESEPIMETLAARYAGRITFRYVMGVLVRDVSDFMTSAELALPQEEGIRQYCRRLARIYMSEESIGGLPIHMEGFCLFDAQHRSSRPLCLAYKAAQLADLKKADAFLRNLRLATVFHTRPTTHEDEILAVVHQTEIEEAAFLSAYRDGRAEEALQKDLAFGQRLGIRSLPAYLIQYKEKEVILQSFDVNEFVAVIEKLST